MKKTLLSLLFFVLFLKNGTAQSYNHSISFNPQRAAFLLMPQKTLPLKLIFCYKQKVSSKNNIWFSASVFHYNYFFNVEKLRRQEIQLENSFEVSTKRFLSKPTVSGIRLGMSYRNIIKENKVFFEYGADIAAANRQIVETYYLTFPKKTLITDNTFNELYISGDIQSRKYNQFFLGITPYLNLSFKLHNRLWLEIPAEIQFLFQKNDNNKLRLQPFRANLPLSFSYYF